jgi:hypothetical protein
MNCLECQELLQQRLDGERLAPTEALDRHLNECATCGELHAASLRLLEGIKQLPAPKAPANFTKSILAQVMRDRRQRQDKMRRRIVVTIALAASVLLMLAAGYYFLPPPADPVLPPKQEFVDIKKPEAAPPMEQIQPKETEKPEPRHAFSALQDRLANTTRDHAKVVLVAANLDGMDKLPAVNELPVDPNVQEVSDGVRSVTRNARKAFDFFARELPMPEVGEPKD